MGTTRNHVLGAGTAALLLMLVACGQEIAVPPTETSPIPTTAPSRPVIRRTSPPMPTPTVSKRPTPTPQPRLVPTHNPAKKENKTEQGNTTGDRRNRALVAVLEDRKVNVYSFKLDGSGKNLLLSEDVSKLGPDSVGTWGPYLLFTAQISDSGNLIVYKLPPFRGATVFYYPSPVYVIDNNGKNQRKILDNVEYFSLSPDGSRVLYHDPRPRSMGLPPVRAPGLNWRMVDIQSRQSQFVVPDSILGHGFSGFLSWVDNERLIFTSSFKYSDELFVFSLSTGEVTKIELPEGEIGFSEISTNASGTRTVMMVSPDGSGLSSPCDIYQLTADWKLGDHIVAEPDHACEGIFWNGDDDFYYVKGTGPLGRISTMETTESGYYILRSVYRYDFETKKDEAVLLSDGKEVYPFLDVLPNKALFVSNESNRRSPAYILEIRDLDGRNPIPFLSGDERVQFLGWTR